MRHYLNDHSSESSPPAHGDARPYVSSAHLMDSFTHSLSPSLTSCGAQCLHWCRVSEASNGQDFEEARQHEGVLDARHAAGEGDLRLFVCMCVLCCVNVEVLCIHVRPRPSQCVPVDLLMHVCGCFGNAAVCSLTHRLRALVIPCAVS